MTPIIRRVAALIFPASQVLAVVLLIKGYADVGDGFSAGLVLALGAVTQYVCVGPKVARRVAAARHAATIGLCGLSLLAAVAFWPLLEGLPPLTHRPAPGATVHALGTLELHTAVLFDLGLFFLVYGMVVLAVDRIALENER